MGWLVDQEPFFPLCPLWWMGFGNLSQFPAILAMDF